MQKATDSRVEKRNIGKDIYIQKGGHPGEVGDLFIKGKQIKDNM